MVVVVICLWFKRRAFSAGFFLAQKDLQAKQSQQNNMADCKAYKLRTRAPRYPPLALVPTPPPSPSPSPTSSTLPIKPIPLRPVLSPGFKSMLQNELAAAIDVQKRATMAINWVRDQCQIYHLDYSTLLGAAMTSLTSAQEASLLMTMQRVRIAGPRCACMLCSSFQQRPGAASTSRLASLKEESQSAFERPPSPIPLRDRQYSRKRKAQEALISALPVNHTRVDIATVV